MTVEASAWRISLSDIDLGPEEEAAVVDVLRSRWLTSGPRIAEFETRFAARAGMAHAVALGNCTQALHLALLAVGVGPGDEVVVPSLTFVATVNAVLYCGATPVFADIEGPDSLLLDPADVARKIGPKTRALLPMHYGGYACEMDAFSALAREHGVRLVDDAAHAPGSSYRGRPAGSLAEASCFSFFGNKNLVTGEGGMVTTDSAEIAEFVKRQRSHGMTAASYDKHRGHAFSYDVVTPGYNYRLTELQAALGLVQLEKLDRNNARRRALVAAYRERLAGIPGLVVPFPGRDDDSACHIFVVVLPEGVDRTAVQKHLKAQGIQTSIHYQPVHRFTRFRDAFSAEVPRLDAVAERLLTLPLHPRLSLEDVAVVTDALRSALA
jgi:dTDP-4-amino-4,6-dideoxygalactose transaminase